MAKGFKTGGRKPGSKNKKTLAAEVAVAAAMERLRLQYDSDGLVLFLGAGVSKPSGIPEWRELIDLMLKALGFGVARAFAWREIEIAGRPKPSVRLSGRMAAWAERVGAGAIDLSMTHSRELANAVAVVARR